MALHVTLTGIRGLVAPPLTIGLYYLLDAWHPLAGPYALLLPLVLVVIGARRFQAMHRGAGRINAGVTRGCSKTHNSPLGFFRSVPRSRCMTRRKIDVRPYSKLVLDGVKQTASRAMLRAVGFADRDFRKPQVGIASTWSNITPCNTHIDKLAIAAAKGADAAGGKSTTFGTITVSDGISMGTPGMRYSLVSREVIADSIETAVGAQGFDGLVALGGCDKNMPGCMMAIARLDRPAVFVYGGTIRPGEKQRDVVSVFEAVGAHAAGKINDKQLKQVERTAIPGPGSCGGMYTANTMASAIEALGHEPGEQFGPGSRVARQARGC